MNTIKILTSSMAMTHPSTLSDIVKHSIDLHVKPLGIEHMRMENDLEFIKGFDVVLFDGGSDVSPLFYGEYPGHNTHTNSSRDVLEKYIYRKCMEINPDIKFSGICRGHQFLAVNIGLKLIQDLRKIRKAHVGYHQVLTRHGSVLNSVVGDLYYTNSLHHQAVDLDFSEDGIVSSIELDTAIVESIETDNIRSVQWHPELMGDVDVLKYLLWEDVLL